MTLFPHHLGVFGGAFDPPHLAHRLLAETALAQLGLEALKVIPTGQAWHKTRTLTPAFHRLAMARLAFEGVEHVEIDEREILRPGPSYTVDTLREIKTEYPEAKLFLVMGQDQAQALTTWRDWRSIVELATICVADRDGLVGNTAHFSPPPLLESRFCALHMPLMDISATGIRARVANHERISPLVSPAIASYIEANHLYLPT